MHWSTLSRSVTQTQQQKTIPVQGRRGHSCGLNDTALPIPIILCQDFEWELNWWRSEALESYLFQYQFVTKSVAEKLVFPAVF